MLAFIPDQVIGAHSRKVEVMTRVSLGLVNERVLTEDEAQFETVRALYYHCLPAPVDWRTVLYQAADIVDHLGWCRGALERDGRYCAAGAIIAAYSRGEMRCEAPADSDWLCIPTVQKIIGKVEDYLNRKRDLDRESLIGWNDDVARNRKQVSALLRRAAAQKRTRIRGSHNEPDASTVHYGAAEPWGAS
jgi:hypothetical protein